MWLRPHPAALTPPPVPFVVLVLVALFLLSVSQKRSTPPPSAQCAAKTYLVGTSRTPATLSQFLRQFQSSTPPADVCIIFVTKRHRHHRHFTQHNLQLIHPPHNIHTAYALALAHAKKIFVADDDVFFFTTHYGTGKSDVHQAATKFSSLLPPISTLDIRAAPRGIINAAAVLTNSTVFARGVPETHLQRTGGIGETYFPGLAPTSATSFPITVFVTATPDVHPHLQITQPWGDVSSVRQPDKPADLGHKALLHSAGSYAPVARPVAYQREAAWLLPWSDDGDTYGDAIAGFTAQRALWEAGLGALVVSPSLDAWRQRAMTPRAGSDLLADVISIVEEARIPRDFTFVDEVYLHLLVVLARRGLLAWRGVYGVRTFHGTLQKLGVPRIRLAPTRYAPVAKGMPDTAVCITGQMRSAPYTHANLLRTLRRGVGSFETLVVTERDDRSGAARLFGGVKTAYSSVPRMHKEWIRMARNSSVVHETMSTERQLQNYLRQLWDMRRCLDLLQEREAERGHKFRNVVRVRPDVVFMQPITSAWWADGAVAHSKRQSYYAVNDRFFAGERRLMGRLLSCHDLFGWVVETGKVYHRKAGDATHMLFKKMINSERFLARCAAWKRVPTKGLGGIDVRRVAWSRGAASWREFG